MRTMSRRTLVGLAAAAASSATMAQSSTDADSWPRNSPVPGGVVVLDLPGPD